MPNLLSLLPVLLCPLGMGLMMWLMMRGNQSTAPAAPQGGPVLPGVASAAPARHALMRGWALVGVCLNPWVLGGLVLIAIGIGVLAPQWIGAALPVLLVAACPLSMLFMMRSMSGSASPARLPAGTTGGDPPRSRPTELAQLRADLARTQAERATILRRLAELDADDANLLPPGAVPASSAAVQPGAAAEQVRAYAVPR